MSNKNKKLGLGIAAVAAAGAGLVYAAQNTRWNDKDFLFAMNGQTGKLAGELPVSNGKFWALFFAIAVPLSVLSSIWVWITLL